VKAEETISEVIGATETIAEIPMTDVTTAGVMIDVMTAEILMIGATTAGVTIDVMTAGILMIEETLEKSLYVPN
jgi:hypothetical protein